MSNPFRSKFDTSCNSCGDDLYENDIVYAIDGQFVCESCADANGNICDECGNYKREEFDLCYDCITQIKEDNNNNYNDNNNESELY